MRWNTVKLMVINMLPYLCYFSEYFKNNSLSIFYVEVFLKYMFSGQVMLLTVVADPEALKK